MWTPGDRERVGDYGCGRSLSDEQWRIIEPFIRPEKPSGRHRDVDMRAVLNALFYVPAASGDTCPLSFPPHRRFTAIFGGSSMRACGKRSAIIW
jgi:hypothetical protein